MTIILLFNSIARKMSTVVNGQLQNVSAIIHYTVNDVIVKGKLCCQ